MTSYDLMSEAVRSEAQTCADKLPLLTSHIVTQREGRRRNKKEVMAEHFLVVVFGIF